MRVLYMVVHAVTCSRMVLYIAEDVISCRNWDWQGFGSGSFAQNSALRVEDACSVSDLSVSVLGRRDGV